ncbi:MAG: hypothetical protein ACRD4I_09740 [Candidatus Angelobacter sp.]
MSFVVPVEQGVPLQESRQGFVGDSGRWAFSALKGGTFLVDDVAELQRQSIGVVLDNWSIEFEFHFGGFARRTLQLNEFITLFEQLHGITLD